MKCYFKDEGENKYFFFPNGKDQFNFNVSNEIADMQSVNFFSKMTDLLNEGKKFKNIKISYMINNSEKITLFCDGFEVENIVEDTVKIFVVPYEGADLEFSQNLMQNKILDGMTENNMKGHVEVRFGYLDQNKESYEKCIKEADMILKFTPGPNLGTISVFDITNEPRFLFITSVI